MVNYSTSMFIGNTTRGIDQPVFWDAHTQIYNNKPPGVLVTGSPGSGKTFLAMTLTSLSAILGKVTIVLDPKGDFISLLPLKEQVGSMNFWNLADPKKKGILDPFYMSEDPGECLDLVLTVIDMFLGGIKSDELRVLSPIVKDVMNSPVPSLLAVTEMLTMAESPIARSLGAELDLVSRLPFAQLCFAPGSKKRNNISIEKGVTIITMVGLQLSADTDGAPSRKQLLSSTIFFLITDFIRRVLHSSVDTTPKSLIIDEAWAVLSTKAGANVIKEVALLGRSKSLSLMLITQNASHLDGIDIENTIKTRFAFHTDSKEAESIIKSMGLPTGENFENILTSLSPGECLMQDYNERYSTVQITDYNKEWKEAFETNPLKKKQKQRAN